MAKSVKKKANRRLKRSVRRTLGALCMMTAIIVAAIPFPDAAASNGASLISGDTGSNVSYECDYKYGKLAPINDETDNDDLEFINNCYDSTNSILEDAYTVEWRENGWVYYKVFSYFMPQNNESNGIIFKYNDIYAKQKVDLTNSVYDDYLVIGAETYNDFYNSDSSVTFSLGDENNTQVTVAGAKKVYSTTYQQNPDGEINKWFFDKFVPDIWSEYKEKWSKYNSDLKDDTIPAEEKAKAPDALSIIPANWISDEKLLYEYFCDTAFKNNADSDYTLQAVSKATDDNKWETVYMPVAVEGTEPEAILGYKEDPNGFLCKTFAKVNGIYKNAFEEVTNVRELSISSEFRYIGDEAFKDSGFLEKVILNTGTNIGNRAFAGCNKLSEVIIPEGCSVIGAEAFKDCGLKNIEIPASVNRIGDGAFAGCTNLSSLRYLGEKPTGGYIGDYAFYDCIKLSNILFGEAGINYIGAGAFALENIDESTLEEFTFPKFISKGEQLGDGILAGRKNLKKVNMPQNFATGLNVETVPENMFYGCFYLEYVKFARNSKYVQFESSDNSGGSKGTKIFYTILNPEFYVTGPGFTTGTIPSYTRKNTWDCTYMQDDSSYVPYVYTDNSDEKHSEVSNGKLILEVVEVGEDGVINNCFFADSESPEVVDELPIKGQIGGIPIVGFGDGCFGVHTDDNSVLNFIEKIDIADDAQIKSIGDSVFKGAKELESVDLGDCVQSVGLDCFADCTSLSSVTFGKNINDIGAGAFKGCTNLEEINFDIPDIIVDINIGENAFSTGGNKLTIKGLIDESYGPFKWAMNPNCFMNPDTGVRVLYKSPEPQNMSVILDNKNNMPTLVDYPHIEDLPNEPDAETSTPGLKDRYLSEGDNGQYTLPERNMIDACINIKIPSGVKSIDACAYFNNSSVPKDGIQLNNGLNNRYSIEAYFSDDDIYKNVYGDEDEGGLFSGHFGGVGGEFTDGATDADGNEYEVMDRGNDRIKSIEMASVEYLPDGAFYSCENLKSVMWSDSMQDVGSVPFEYCTKLVSVGGSTAYSCNEGILYKNNADGIPTTLVECLASRGTEHGAGFTNISLTTDPSLLTVTEIEPGAFRNCKELISADFYNGGKVQFTTIPEDCFNGDNRLAFAYLPESVSFIGKNAFANTGESTDVWVYNRGAVLGETVFGTVGEDDNSQDDVKKPKLTAYEDAPIRKQALEKYPYINIKQVIPEDGSLQVTFYVRQDDGQLKTIYVIGNDDNNPKNEPKVYAGDDLSKWAPSGAELYAYIPSGYELVGWEGLGDLTNITQNCFFIAKIVEKDTDGDGTADNEDEYPNDPNNGGNGTGGNGGNTDGNGGNTGDNGGNTGGNGGNTGGNGGNTGGNGGNTGGNDGNNGGSSDNNGSSNNTKKYTLTIVYGNGSGTYASGSTVIISAIEPPAGKEFYKWTTNNTGVTITSATSAATTVKTTGSDAVVTATYRDKSSVSSNTVNRKPIGSSSGSTVQISKPGISNTDKAYASVSGSTDNFVVKITESTAAANAVATALSNTYMDMNPIKYFAMDISLYDKNGNQVTNTNGLSVNVTMPIPDALVQYGGNNKVGAVVNGNTLEPLNCKFTTVSGIPCVTFTATHFSPYTIYVDTSNLSVNTLDSTPKTGDGIHPKWFFSIGLACISLLLFMKKDKVTPRKALIS